MQSASLISLERCPVMKALHTLRSFILWLRLVLSIPKKEWSNAISTSSLKRFIILQALLNDVPPLKLTYLEYDSCEMTLSTAVTHQSFSIT